MAERGIKQSIRQLAFVSFALATSRLKMSISLTASSYRKAHSRNTNGTCSSPVIWLSARLDYIRPARLSSWSGGGNASTAQGALLNQNAVRIRALSSDVDQSCLGYFGRSREFHDFIISRARGSANQVRMAIGLLKEMPLQLPPVALQRRITGILSAYDELMANCQRRIGILERWPAPFTASGSFSSAIPATKRFRALQG